MPRKSTKIAVFQLVNVDINTIMDKYAELTESTSYRSILLHKFLFLIHLIITHCRTSKENKIELNSERLEDVLGNNYNYMLLTLQNMEIITIDERYSIGEHCHFITLNDWNIKVEVLPNTKVIKYLDKWKKLNIKAKKDAANKLDAVVKIVDGKPQIQLVKKGGESLSQEEISFRSKYEDSLSYLKLKVGKNDGQEFINSLFSDYDNHSYHYYSTCIQEFNEKNLKIYSIDKQGRIYHILTSLPKKLKTLFNIKYQLDIANSHPLLFSKVLINKYKIEIETLRIIYNIDKEEYINNIHNVTEMFCNKLNTNNLSVPIDVLRYIYVCSKGLMWDDFAAIFEEFAREEVKIKAFKEIFYPKKDFTEHTEFGKKFIELYPNVHQVIREIKKVTKLPNLMMMWESRLMKEILNTCYDQGWKVVNIHDAIIVFDVEDNASVRPIQIKHIINEIYRRYLLHPTIHLDVFNNN